MRALAVIFGLIVLTGCANKEGAPSESPKSRYASGGGTSDVKKDESPPKPAPVSEPAEARGNMWAADAPRGGQTTTPTTRTEQKPALNRDFVIYTAHFVMAVYQVERGIAAVEKIAKDQGGYLAIKKDHEITIRIPRAKFEAAVASVDAIGDVIHRDIAAEDVTDEHVDLEIRIKNARAMQKQLTDLLVRANVKEALEIEKELARVTQELELLEGRFKLLNDRIAFSTITVNFEARGTTITTQRVRLPFPWLNTLNLPTLLQLNEEK
jgi:hypothetical protein